MAEDTTGTGDYEIGYGKPPKATQWPKGQSGNPSGKRKKEQSLAEIIAKLADEEIVVQRNGVTCSMTQKEAMLRSVLAKAIKNGDLPAAKFIAEQLETGSVARLVEDDLMTEADLSVMASQANWQQLLDGLRAEKDAPSEGPEIDEEMGDDYPTEDF